MTGFKRLSLILLVVISCVGCDQVTKSVATQVLAKHTEPITYLNGMIRFQYVENTGGFLGFGAGIPDALRFWLFTVGVSFVLILGLMMLLKARHLSVLTTVALACIVGGGVGNLIDRFLNNGRVVDFLNIGISFVRTGVFNMADVAVMFGALALLILSVLQRGESPP